MTIRMVFLFLCMYVFSSRAMHESSEYQYRCAQQEDVPELLALINTQAAHDHTKIVIVPKKFREAVLRSSIEKKRIFIAYNHRGIVGYKKLFLVNDDAEKSDMLRNEIRCVGEHADCVFAGYIVGDGTIMHDNRTLSSDCYHVCVYNGGDFTAPEHRRKGINKTLTDFALQAIAADIMQSMHDAPSKMVTMLFGLTKANAGEIPGDPSDRTPGIHASFATLMHGSVGERGSVPMPYRRYRAFMPTFDPESDVLQPLADEHAISGFGCVLTYQLQGA